MRRVSPDGDRVVRVPLKIGPFNRGGVGNSGIAGLVQRTELTLALMAHGKLVD